MLRDPNACLRAVVEACQAIEAATRGLDLKAHPKSRLVRSAVEREFIIMGVALAALSRRAPQVFGTISQARRIIDFSNRLTHEYPAIDDTIVWSLADRDVPVLLAECQAHLHKDSVVGSTAGESGKPLPGKSLSLGRVLNQTEEIKENVEEAGSNLSSVNEILKQEKDVALPARALEDALVQNEELENQIAKAADDLEQVNADLATEVTERVGLEAEFAELKVELAEVREDLSQALVRAEDTVSRWGGDEFVCLLLNVQIEADMAHLAQKMVNRIAEPCAFAETVLSISVSIGVTIYPGDGETADVLFRNADEAMYEAKRTEKGIHLFR
ncbi:MAG: diguanylate cyclase [bacterium]|nr:diguanylate cyclase [bacterium]